MIWACVGDVRVVGLVKLVVDELDELELTKEGGD